MPRERGASTLTDVKIILHVGDATLSTRTLALLLAGVGLSLSTAACTGGTSTPAAAGTPTGAATTPAGPEDAKAQVRLADEGAYPFQVALLNLKATDEAGEPAADDVARLSCGGSLLDERHVLTAGHCFDVEGENPPDPLQDIQVVIGRTTLSSRQGEVRGISEVQVHPQYSTRPLEYDVAVLTLDEPVTGITPVTLVQSGDTSLEQAGSPATFTGWGSLEPQKEGEATDASASDGMKQASVLLEADDACRSAYDEQEIYAAPDMQVSLCTSTADEIGHCNGDSGGPLFVSQGDQVVQLGVVSFSLGCGDPRYPSVYARLSNGDINSFLQGAVR